MCVCVCSWTRNTGTSLRICGLTWQLIIAGFVYSQHVSNPKLACRASAKISFPLIIHGGVNWSMDLLSLECESSRYIAGQLKKSCFKWKFVQMAPGVLQMAVNPVWPHFSCSCLADLPQPSRFPWHSRVQEESCLIGLWHCSLRCFLFVQFHALAIWRLSLAVILAKE